MAIFNSYFDITRGYPKNAGGEMIVNDQTQIILSAMRIRIKQQIYAFGDPYWGEGCKLKSKPPSIHPISHLRVSGIKNRTT